MLTLDFLLGEKSKPLLSQHNCHWASAQDGHILTERVPMAGIHENRQERGGLCMGSKWYLRVRWEEVCDTTWEEGAEWYEESLVLAAKSEKVST